MDWLDRLFKQAEEQERKRDRELKKIANGILAKLPKCDFEPCAVCGNKPELEVTIYGDNTYRVDVKCRKCKDGTGYNDARAGSNGLDNHVFAQSAFAFGSSGYTYGNDGDRNGGFKYLTYFQPQIGGCGREKNGHCNPPGNRP